MPLKFITNSPKVWLFDSGQTDSNVNSTYEAGPTITFYLGKWGSPGQFCSDRPKTSDLDVSDGLKSIPAVPKRKISGAKSFFFFLDSILFSYPTPPFSTLRDPGKRQISIRSKSDKKKSGSQLQPKNRERQKKIYRLNRVPWGELETPHGGFSV